MQYKLKKNTIGDTEYDDFHFINKGKLYDLAVAGVKILHQKNKRIRKPYKGFRGEIKILSFIN